MRCSTPVSCSSVSGSNVVMMQRCRRSCTPMTTSPILNRAPSQVRSSSPETPPITMLGRRRRPSAPRARRSEEHTSELQSPYDLVCRLLLEKKKKNREKNYNSNYHVSIIEHI